MNVEGSAKQRQREAECDRGIGRFAIPMRPQPIHGAAARFMQIRPPGGWINRMFTASKPSGTRGQSDDALPTATDVHWVG